MAPFPPVGTGRVRGVWRRGAGKGCRVRGTGEPHSGGSQSSKASGAGGERWRTPGTGPGRPPDKHAANCKPTNRPFTCAHLTALTALTAPTAPTCMKSATSFCSALSSSATVGSPAPCRTIRHGTEGKPNIKVRRRPGRHAACGGHHTAGAWPRGCQLWHQTTCAGGPQDHARSSGPPAAPPHTQQPVACTAAGCSYHPTGTAGRTLSLPTVLLAGPAALQVLRAAMPGLALPTAAMPGSPLFTAHLLSCHPTPHVAL